MNRTVVTAILVSLLLAVSASAQNRPGFDETTSVVVVEVPVNVYRDGAAVRGLTREDFEVFDGRKQQPLVGFEVVDLEAIAVDSRQPGIDRQEIPSVARRHFLLLFDLSFSSRQSLKRSIIGAKDLLASSLHSTDLVGVGFYSRSRGAGMLLNFTSDRRQVYRVTDQLEQAIDGKKETERESRKPQDPLRLVAGNLSSLARDVGGGDNAGEILEGLGGGGRGAGFLAETLFDMNRANVAQAKARGRSAFKSLADSLGNLADATAGIEGRKFLVYFSEGFENDLFYEQVTTRRSLLDRQEGTGARSNMDKMIDRFRRAGWTIQTVDAGGVRADQRLTDGDALNQMARETGGEMYRNFNDLGGAMDEMLGKTAITYILSFQVENVRDDGDFHPIKVKLRDEPRGTKLMHRTGYYAPTKKEQATAFEESLSTAEMILSGETGGELDLSALVATFRGPGDRAQVTTWLEVAGEDLMQEHGGSSLPLEIYAYVLDGTGEIRDFFTQDLQLDLAQVGDRLRGSRFKYYGDFILEAGEYDLRLLVRNKETGRHALRSYTFDVPTFPADTPRLLPPFFLDDSDAGAIVVRERVEDAEVGNYPYIIGEDEQFIPDVAPAITADSARSRVCLMGYHLGQEDLLLDVGLSSADGTALGKERLQVVGRGETTDQGLDRLYFSLDTNGLPPGEYQLGVSIHDLERGAVEQAYMPFRILG